MLRKRSQEVVAKLILRSRMEREEKRRERRKVVGA
jgi:hypothetical protein